MTRQELIVRDRIRPRAMPRPRDVLGEFGMYVHIPFCAHRCWYCDFNAYAGMDYLIDAYMTALVADAGSGLSAPGEADLAVKPEVTSVFIGGGTPSLADAVWIERLLGAVRGSWPLAAGAEITIECNPESITADKLDEYLSAGVNRISFGVQSLDDELLRSLGRLHDSARALEALRMARIAGFGDVNADLIFGVPGEDDDLWLRSLEGVLSCEPTHVSCYALTYEEGTPLHSWRRLGKVKPVGDDDAARRWELTQLTLESAGLERYEISNWAKPGRQSRHNSLYWAGGEYIGVGAGAHSHLASSAAGAVRSWTVKAPQRYIREVSCGNRPVAGSEFIDRRGRAAEVMFVGLRRRRGVDAGMFAALTGFELETHYGAEIASCVSDGLLTWDGTTAALTHAGTLLADDVMVRFVC